MILQFVFCLVISVIIAFALTSMILFLLDCIVAIIARVLITTGFTKKFIQPSEQFTEYPNQETNCCQYSAYIPKPFSYLVKFIINQNYLKFIPYVSCCKNNLRNKNTFDMPTKPIGDCVEKKFLNSPHAPTLPQEKDGNQPNGNDTTSTES